MSSLSGGPEQNPPPYIPQRLWKTFGATLSEAELRPTAASSGAAHIGRLKRDLVTSLFVQDGPFWEAVLQIRTKWGVRPQVMVPSEDDHSTTMPVDKLPRKRLEVDDREWDDDIHSLIKCFVPDMLVRSGWHSFLGACIMCNPPKDRLGEFAEYGRIYPSPFWPPVECDPDEIDKSQLRSMIAPPIERVWKEPAGEWYEDGEQFAEYRIVVDEHTKEKDVIHAFRAIKAAYGFRNPGGKPPIDKLAAVQCAILYDDHNGPVPEDRRARIWTYKKLAARFRGLGVKNERSAEEHVKRGRELRKKFRSP